MRVAVLDDDALGTPSPRHLRIYLRARGWERGPNLGSRDGAGPDVWTLRRPEGLFEVITPSSRQARDYVPRMAELLRTVSIAEGRSELDVLRDLTTSTYDVQYFRTNPGGPPGTAPLRTAAEAFAAAHNVLATSTATLEEPRLVLPPRRPAQTTQLLNKVLAGPTHEGSYVISVWVPIPPRLAHDEDQVLFDDDTVPFERAATRHLYRSLNSTREAAQEALDTDAGLDAFILRAADGISANLCEALVSFGGDEDSRFDVSFSWALDRPVGGVDRLPPVEFPGEAVPVIREAARELRASIPEEEVRVRGNIVRLHREGQLGSGDVTIAGTVIGDPMDKLRRVSVNLSEADYQAAINAHESFADIEISGSLTQRGTRTYLTDSRGLAVLPDSRD